MAKPRATAKRNSIYGVHPSVQMVQDWIATLKEKSGRSLEEWLTFIRKSGKASEEERRDWLKRELGLGTNTAWWLAERSCGKGGAEDTPEAYLAQAPKYVEAMFEGKESLRPLYEQLLLAAAALGADVKACPCQTIVPLYRRHVFAQLRPSTRTRLDLGLALGPLLKAGREPLPERLVDTGGFKKKDRITHRIAIGFPADIDAEVKRWLKRAYDLDAKEGRGSP